MAAGDISLTAPHSRQGYEILPISQRDLAKRRTSVPLILPNDYQYDSSSGKIVQQTDVIRTHLVLVDEAVELLQDVTDPVSVVGVCGPARSGKSYVLSRMVGAHDAFELGNEMNPQTFGIWMGTKVLKNIKKGFTTILIDSEGTDAFDAEAANDVGIMVMTVLLTSQLIYNSVKAPKKKDLEELKILTDVTGKIRAKENEQVTEDMGALRRVFPYFMWLLRDVHLKFHHPVTKQPMTPTEFVKEVVFSRDPRKKEETDQEKIGSLMLRAFQQVEAFDLPIPGDEELLADIAANADAIRPKFNVRMGEFIEHILSSLECKRGMTVGSQITGDQLATMLQKYVEAVNDPDTIPAMKSAWDASVELRRRKILEDMVVKYNTEMTKAIEEVCLRGSEMVPMEERNEKTSGTSLMSIHDAVMDNVHNELNKQIGFLGYDDDNKDNPTLILNFNEKIVKRDNQSQENITVVGGELLRYLQENRDRSRCYCEKVFKKLLDELKNRLSPIPDDYTEKTLEADLAKLKESYLQQAIGPMKLDVLQERWESSDMTGFFQMCKTIKGFQLKVAEATRKQEALEMESEKQQRDLQNLREESERQKTEHEKAIKDIENNHKDSLEKLQKSQDEERIKFEKKMEDLQKANQQDKMEMMQAAQKKAEEQTMNKALELQQQMFDMKLEHQRQMTEKQLQAERDLRRAEDYSRDLKQRNVFQRLFNMNP